MRRINRFLSLLIVFALLFGCARSAPSQPPTPSTTSGAPQSASDDSRPTSSDQGATSADSDGGSPGAGTAATSSDASAGDSGQESGTTGSSTPVDGPAQSVISPINVDLLALYDNREPLTETPPPFEQVVDDSLALQPTLEAMAAALDPAQYDLVALNDALDFDAEQIVAFVDEQIAYDPYVGVLRGAEGTLLSRAGNDVDQALLLQRLLEDAGYETRIAQATLTTAQAQELLAQALVRPDVPSLADDPDLRAARQALASQLGLAAPATSPQRGIPDQIAPDIALVRDALAQARIRLDDEGQLRQLLDEVASYHWLQYRLSPFDEWSDAHTTFGSAAPALEVEETYLEALPDDLYHYFEFTVVVERKEQDTLTTHTIVAPRRFTTASLVGRSLTFMNQPNNFDLLSPDGVDAMLASSSIYLPVLNGEMAGDGFDLSGRPFALDLLAMDSFGAAPLFQTVADQTEAAIGAIGGLGDDESAGSAENIFALTGQWIEYTLVAPGNERTTTRRYVLDRIGESNREAGIAEITDGLTELQAARQLMTMHTIAVVPGSYAPQYVTHRYLTRLGQEYELLAYIEANPELTEWPSDLVAQIDPAFDVDAATIFDAFLPEDVIAFRSEPTVVVKEQGILPQEGTLFGRIDVINNTRTVLREAGGQALLDPEAAVAIGVVETAVEPILLNPVTADITRPSNTLESMRQAKAAGIDLTVLLPDDPAAAQSLGHSEAVRRSIERDLAAGYVVIVPAEATGNDDTAAWWRVDPVTGETLGVATMGYGQAFVEYLISLMIAVPLFPLSQALCMEAGGSAGCCFVQNLAVGALGFGIGFAVGKVATYSVAMLVADVGFNGLANMPFFPNFCAP